MICDRILASESLLHTGINHVLVHFLFYCCQLVKAACLVQYCPQAVAGQFPNARSALNSQS